MGLIEALRGLTPLNGHPADEAAPQVVRTLDERLAATSELERILSDDERDALASQREIKAKEKEEAAAKAAYEAAEKATDDARSARAVRAWAADLRAKRLRQALIDGADPRIAAVDREIEAEWERDRWSAPTLLVSIHAPASASERAAYDAHLARQEWRQDVRKRQLPELAQKAISEAEVTAELKRIVSEDPGMCPAETAMKASTPVVGLVGSSKRNAVRAA